MKFKKAGSKGFTLVQISALLMVASLVMVMVLPTSQKKLDADRVTTQRMNDLMKYFRAYMVQYGKLPCPADATLPTGSANYGVAAANGGTTSDCYGGSPSTNYKDNTNHVAIGMVPVKSLGIPVDMALDAYGRNITYAVDTNLTVACWASPAAGTITVTENGVAATSVMALISHGANGHGAYIPLPGASGTGVRLDNSSADSDERTNAHVDGSFAATPALNGFVKKAPTATFDDIVVYSSPLWNMKILPTNATPVEAITSFTPPSDGYYYTGQTLTFTVTYGSAVTVTGIPRIPLVATVVGGGGVSMNGAGTGYANYASGTGTTTLTFTYTPILAADIAPNGFTTTSPIDLNGGTISGCTAFAVPSLAGVVLPKVTFVTATGPWTVPADWNSSKNKIEAVGSGGNGAQGGATAGGGGGGGGAYQAITNYSDIAGTVLSVAVGTAGGTTKTQFKDATTLLADYGTNATTSTKGTGGTVAGGYPGNSGSTPAYAGGDGANANITSQGGAGGGGGAAGPTGVGMSGGLGRGTGGGGGGGGGANGGGTGGSGIATHGDGGSGGNGAGGYGAGSGTNGVTSGNSLDAPLDNYFGGGGGGSGGSNVVSGTTGTGGAGINAENWVSKPGAVVAGVGGGGGGSGGNSGNSSLSGNGGAGGGYGGGGGGSGGAQSAPGAAGVGAGGLIVITYR